MNEPNCRAFNRANWDERVKVHLAAESYYIKRLDRQIVSRFSVAEVRISASTNELCDRLTQGFLGNESPADQSL